MNALGKVIEGVFVYNGILWGKKSTCKSNKLLWKNVEMWINTAACLLIKVFFCVLSTFRILGMKVEVKCKKAQ